MKPQIRMFNRIGFVREIPKDVEDTRVIPFTISNSTRDRHRTVLNMDNWNLDNYKANPIVGYQHQVYGGFRNDPDYVIGTSDVSIQEKELIGAVKFEPEKINPLSEKIFRKVLHGTLRAASVGFIPVGMGKFGEEKEAEGQENETYYYAGQELLEWSIVNIGSNPTAVKRNILSQFGELLLNYFPVEDIKKMSVEELLNYTEAVERDDIEADERPYPNEHAARIRDPKDFEQDSFRRKNIDKGVDVIFGKLKGETTTTTQAYRFKKDVFTVEQAKKWLKDHKIEYISFEPASEKDIDSNYHKRKRELDLLTI